MRPAARLAALLCAAALVLVGCGLLGGGPDDVAEDFATAWSAGDDAVPPPSPTTRGPPRSCWAVRAALAPTALTVTVGQVRTATDRAVAAVDLRWDLGEGRVWSYPGELELRPAPGSEEGWAVRWAPSVVHPQLGERQRLALRPEPATPGPSWTGRGCR